MTSRFLVDPSGGSTSTDPALASKVKQAYNDVLANGSTLTFTSINGGQKQVSVAGGTTGSVQAFNGATLDTTTNEVTFSSTTGNAAHEVTLDLDPMLTPLEGTVGGHTTDINDFKSREQFKNVTQHPDLADSQMGSFNPTVNGRSYVFSHSSSQGGSYFHRYGFRSGSEKWLSNTQGVHAYNTLVNGYYNYSGLQGLDGNSGEWIQVQLPEAVIMNSFTISAASSESIPRSFVIVGSNDGTNYDLLGQYTDVAVATTDAGTHFKLDSSLGAYGTAYDRYAIVVTRVQRSGAKQNVAIRHLRYFSVSKDVSDAIAQTATLLTSNGGFSGTPPSTITLTGTWGNAGYNYQPLSHTTTSVIYNMVNTANNNPFGGYGIVFTIVSNQLRLYVNDSTHGYNEPTSFTINGNAASEGDVVNGNDTIALILTSPPGVTDTFTVPSELIPQTITTLSEYYKLADWKTLIAGCADFAAFKTAVAAL